MISMLRSVFRAPRRVSPERVSKPSLRFDVLEDRLTPNNRFVVPLDVPADNSTTFHTAHLALTTAGITSGDTVEIKQGAEPGTISTSSLTGVANLTIRGDAAVGPTELGELGISGLFVAGGNTGLKLQNLNIVLTNTFTMNVPTTLSGNRISTMFSGSNGLQVGAGANVEILNNQIVTNITSRLITVTSAAGSQNLIAGNVIQAANGGIHLDYEGSGATLDVVRDNIFIGGEGAFGTSALFVQSTVNGLTILRNKFRDADLAGAAIAVAGGSQNIKVLQNTIEFPAGASATDAISIGQVSFGSSSGIISGNIIQVNQGIGIHFNTPSGALSYRVDSNDILDARVGVLLESTGGTYSNVDLGGGSQGSPGANNFRFLRSTATTSSAAIIATGSGGNVSAQNNLFNASLTPEAAVIDVADDAARPDVVTTNNLTGNAAFVQALFVRFLRRPGNVANPSDAGAFVNQLNAGGNPATVVNNISRSAEAFGFVVDDLFHTILNRDADAGGRATWVNQLVAGATIESVKGGFFASVEYTSRFAADRAFVVSLYSLVLHRLGSDAEYASWVALIPSQGRAGVATSILNSTEAHGQSAARLYISILKRPAGPTEISLWASSGLDELSIQTGIAASPEGQGII